MAKESDRLLGHLEGKLEELHADVKGLREDVDALKKDFIQRGVVYKGMGWLIGMLTALMSVVANFLLFHSGK